MLTCPTNTIKAHFFKYLLLVTKDIMFIQYICIVLEPSKGQPLNSADFKTLSRFHSMYVHLLSTSH